MDRVGEGSVTDVSHFRNEKGALFSDRMMGASKNIVPLHYQVSVYGFDKQA